MIKKAEKVLRRIKHIILVSESLCRLSEYIQETKCKDYDFAEVMQACRVCVKEPCSILVLFDNNS